MGWDVFGSLCDSHQRSAVSVVVSSTRRLGSPASLQHGSRSRGECVPNVELRVMRGPWYEHDSCSGGGEGDLIPVCTLIPAELLPGRGGHRRRGELGCEDHSVPAGLPRRAEGPPVPPAGVPAHQEGVRRHPIREATGRCLLQ